jgi:Flp pilus assembly pilin Flp
LAAAVVHFFCRAAPSSSRRCLERSHASCDSVHGNPDKEVHVHGEGRAVHRVFRHPRRIIRLPAWNEHGQGTVEYVALVALVALIMVGVIAAMKSTQLAEGQQLGSLILRKIAEAVSKVHY